MPDLLSLFLILLLVAGFIVISYYMVKQQSVAIIERFRRYQNNDSGIHMRVLWY